MSVEQLTVAPAQEVAEKLVDELLHAPKQLQLFTTSSPFDARAVESLKKGNPEKIVISSRLVENSRYMAAFLGAGFHDSQYEDVMLGKLNDPGEVGKLIVGLYFQMGRVPVRQGVHNRMYDEVSEELFTTHVPTTKYDPGTNQYITTPEDLQRIFEFDYNNLSACRRLGFDLLYERED